VHWLDIRVIATIAALAIVGSGEKPDAAPPPAPPHEPAPQLFAKVHAHEPR
jgi:hypothetical protein